MSVLEMKEGNIAKLTITVDKDAFVKALNDAYHKTGSRYPVPGFRKGKAPRKVIEANYGAMVFYDEAFDLCWAEPYDAAVAEHKLVPVDRPSVVDIPVMSETEGVTYVAEVQLKPEVTLGQYKGIAVKKLAYTVTDEEVDNALKMEQQKQVRYEDVDRPVENGDRIILDYCGKVDGVAFEGGTAQDQTLDIGSHTFIPGFEEQLVGVNPGEEKDIHVTFPEEYHAENLKGKAAVFTCKVKTVQKKELPEIDDEFIKDISEQDTVAEWKENKKQELLKARETAAKNARENELLEKAADNARVDIPDCMVNREVQYMMQNIYINDAIYHGREMGRAEAGGLLQVHGHRQGEDGGYVPPRRQAAGEGGAGHRGHQEGREHHRLGGGDREGRGPLRRAERSHQGEAHGDPDRGRQGLLCG